MTQPPTDRDEVPNVRIARNPVYDHTGTLLEADFKPGSIEEWTTVIDHWVANFQAEVLQDDGTYQRTAYGIGLPPEKVWNHKNIQTFGNRKDLMDGVLHDCGVGIDTWNVLDHEGFTASYGSNREIIYKPQGGSLGDGIAVFPNLKALREAIRDRKVQRDGFIQPYLSIHDPIQGLKGATKEDAEILRDVNNGPDRVRELRMHTLTTTSRTGQLQAEAYPTLKISKPGTKTMQTVGCIALDPSCVPPDSYIHRKSVAVGKALCIAAGQDGVPMSQCYSVSDWLIPGGDMTQQGQAKVGDGNCRLPGLNINAPAARQAFVKILAGQQ
ncbi:MAG TPA: hypothetical protein VMY99_04330 [Nevskiaceae bacterium]|nr:hypothetical protein [Nevskiaceae bacterium]